MNRWVTAMPATVPAAGMSALAGITSQPALWTSKAHTTVATTTVAGSGVNNPSACPRNIRT